ncbi:MAG: diguanylate cyclase [Elioraea sp.]|nr:diguanylate cyclase [Elioraea sp.]
MTVQLLPPAVDSALRAALVESRQRWRDFVAMAADLAWETDGEGRLTFVHPDPALGWPAAELLGRPAEDLLAEAATGKPAFSPFRPEAQTRGVRAWLRRADGELVCLSFAAVPLYDQAGRLSGARGLARDVTEEERRSASLAAALRREALIDAILQEARTEILARDMLRAAVRALLPALGAAGAAVLEGRNGSLSPVAKDGEPLAGMVAHAARLAPRLASAPVTERIGARVPLIAAPARQPGGESGVLLVWRARDGRDWDEEEGMLVAAAGDFLGLILAQHSLQAEMLRQARTDPLTGLLNRRAFLEELERRLDRLAHERRPGALLFVDLDNLKQVNDRLGHDAGDSAIRAAAELLRAAVRPTDLVARLGGDEFALWLDGADLAAAVARAERLVADARLALAHAAPPEVPLSLSIGVAVRTHRDETVGHLLTRADAAMYAVKRDGKAGWAVAPCAK